jgi:hypothetical protein
MKLKVFIALILGAILLYMFITNSKKEHMTSTEYDNFKALLLTHINSKKYDQNIIKDINDAYIASQTEKELANRLPKFQANVIKHLDKDTTEQLYFNLRMMLDDNSILKSRMIESFLILGNLNSLQKLGNFTLDNNKKNIVKLLLVDYATNGKFTIDYNKLSLNA